MRMTQYFIPTLREVPNEAEISSHQLMLRAGIMRKMASGIYSFLPLGYRVFEKVERIVDEEMERAGAQKLIMPCLLPAKSYQDSGRWELYGPEMFRVKDRASRDFCLGPSHEEVFTEIVKNEIHSYKSLPIILYQLQNKYRDEIRPRYGVMRSREFLMKDAYSYDKDDEGLDLSYRKMQEAYTRVFTRMCLDFTAVEADNGVMGGSGSQEFMVKSDIGEAVIAFCDGCGYAANDEKAECVAVEMKGEGEKSKEQAPVEKVATPDFRTIEELTKFFKCSSKRFVKTLIYKADDKYVAALVRGDREVQEVKLQNSLGSLGIEMATPEEVQRIIGTEIGFLGPIGLNIPIIADQEIVGMSNFITGANDNGYHLTNVNIGRDFKDFVVKDIRKIEAGDKCPKCGEPVKVAKGIEVGHLFKLGTKYSKALKCNYLDENGVEKPMIMGSYGIGINRTVAAIIEQNNDESGIIWPFPVAPFHVIVVPINMDEEVQVNLAEQIYQDLKKAGVEVIIDDRDQRAGVKFKDADLIGIPLRIAVGKKADAGIVEFKLRAEKNFKELDVAGAVAEAQKVIAENSNKNI